MTPSASVNGLLGLALDHHVLQPADYLEALLSVCSHHLGPERITKLPAWLSVACGLPLC